MNENQIRAAFEIAHLEWADSCDGSDEVFAMFQLGARWGYSCSRGEVIAYRWIGDPCGEPIYCENLPETADLRFWEPVYRHPASPAAVPIDFKGQGLIGIDLTLWPGAKIYNARLIDCNIDDVEFGPFDYPVFEGCILVNARFRSGHGLFSVEEPQFDDQDIASYAQDTFEKNR